MINFEKIFKTSERFIRKNKGLITTIGAIAGLGVSLYLTAKATVKVEEILDVAQPGDEKEVRKEVIKEVSKPAMTTALTIFCIVLTYRFGKQAEAGLLTLVAGAGETFRRYREGVIDSGKLSPEEEEKIFDKAHHTIEDDIPPLPQDEDYNKYELFKEELTGEFFWATKETILNAEISLNRNVNIKCCETFWFFLQCLTDNGTFDDYRNGAERCGWCDYAEEEYGYRYVDICTKKCTDEETGREYTYIYYPYLPHADFEDVDWTDGKNYEVTRLLKSR